MMETSSSVAAAVSSYYHHPHHAPHHNADVIGDDGQQPSTSSASSSAQPGASPAWLESASGQSSHFGTLPEAAAPEDWQLHAAALHMQQQQQHAQQQQPQPILLTGGRAMRQQMAALRLARTDDWAGGGLLGGPGVPASPVRTPSLLSLQSEVSGVSGMTACSGLSTMTGLTVRTDYSEAELNRVAHEKLVRGAAAAVAAAQQQSASPLTAAGAAGGPADSDETRDEQYVRQMLTAAPADQGVNVFQWTADDRHKSDPLYRTYRKMVLRVYAKKDVPPEVSGRPGVYKMLKLLSDCYPHLMRKILEDLWADLQDCVGKDRSDTLHSLYDCASATPEAIASLLRQPPKARPGRPEFSMRDIVQCVDPRGDDSVSAARFLVRLAEPHLRYDDLRKRAINDEGLRRLLAAVLHERDVAPAKRIILIEALKKYNKKSEFLKMEGVASILRFLNKDADENGSAPVPDNVTLVRVEREEPLLHHALCFLRSLVVARVGGGRRDVIGASRNRDAFVEQLARHNAVQILSSWLDHGSTRLLHEIAAILGALSASKALAGKDLSVAIRSVIQLLGTDDAIFTAHLITFVKNVAQLAPAHKRSAIDSRACNELLQYLHKWTIATEREPRATQDRWYSAAIYEAVETLDVLTEADTVGGQEVALDALLKARELAVPVLLRVATSDYLYPQIRSMSDPAARNVAWDAAFDALTPDARVAELRTKYYALNVLQRMCMRPTNIASLGLAAAKDPLHGESLMVMLWRRMWDMYRQVFMLHTKQQSAKWRATHEDFAPVVSTIRCVTYLAQVLYGDPACFAQVLGLVGVPKEAPDGTKPMLNPFKLLSTPTPHLSTAVLQHVDALMANFRRHAIQTHKHPMAVWLQPGARDDGGDYKEQFLQTVTGLQAGSWLAGDAAQRLINNFNECMGTHSPSFTPGGFAHHPHHAAHHLHHPGYPPSQLMQHGGGYPQQ